MAHTLNIFLHSNPSGDESRGAVTNNGAGGRMECETTTGKECVGV